MMIPSCQWLALFGLLSWVHMNPVVAENLYRWSDDQGQVHYSDQPPDQPHGSVDVRALPRATQSQRAVGERYSVMEQVRQMEAERAERERARQAEDMRRLQLQRRVFEVEAARANANQAARASASRPYFVHPPPPPPPGLHPPMPPGQHPPPPHGRPAQNSLRSLTVPGRSLTIPGRSLHPHR